MRQLSVYFFSNCSLLQHNRDGVIRLRQWSDKNIDIPIADPRRGNLDFITIDGRAIVQRIGHESQNGRIGRNEVRELRAQQGCAAHVEEGLRCGIDVDHHALHVDDKQRLRKRVQDLCSVRASMSGMRGHAAFLAQSPSKTRDKAPTSQGAPTAARPTITPAAPETASIVRASSAVAQSPLTTTGIETELTTARTAAQSARPS